MKKNTQILQFTINLEPVTKKNSQQILVNKKTHKPFIAPSKKFTAYEKQAFWDLPNVQEPINVPVNIKCIFYKGTARKGDLTNYLEAIDDVLTKYHIIEDDNSDIVAGHDGSRIRVDREHPRTEVTITLMDEDIK